MAIVEGYATLPEVKADLRLTTTVDDARIERAIEAASRQIDLIAKRKWGYPATEARPFTSSGQHVFVDEVTSITLVEESDDQDTWATVESTSYTTNPRGPVRYLVHRSAEWSSFVRITGTYDGEAIPPQINQASRIQAARLFKRPDTPEGVLEGDFGALRLARIDPDVVSLVRNGLGRKIIG